MALVAMRHEGGAYLPFEKICCISCRGNHAQTYDIDDARQRQQFTMECEAGFQGRRFVLRWMSEAVSYIWVGPDLGGN